jgi:hypothetical protein
VYTYTAREGRRESETRKRETHFSKECVFLCQFVGPSEGDEELRAVVIGACVGTAHEASPDKLESSVELILECMAVYALSTFSSACGVSSLSYEVLDNSVEDGSIVVVLHAELDKVPAGQRSLFAPQLDVQVPQCRLYQDLSMCQRLLVVNIAHASSFSTRSLEVGFTL